MFDEGRELVAERRGVLGAQVDLVADTGEPEAHCLIRLKKEIKKGLAKSVTKTIAAFLNSDGGTLVIGVEDSGTVLGIEPDFEHLRQGTRR